MYALSFCCPRRPNYCFRYSTVVVRYDKQFRITAYSPRLDPQTAAAARTEDEEFLRRGREQCPRGNEKSSARWRDLPDARQAYSARCEENSLSKKQKNVIRDFQSSVLNLLHLSSFRLSLVLKREALSVLRTWTPMKEKSTGSTHCG
jgi:hypothetical protein